ncbi:MAG: PKD domain-containing protein [Methanomassiliicoccales archaeon]|nr:MAG: PKD domain-containing protein [Methanomassiliicoccales archaeon]
MKSKLEKIGSISLILILVMSAILVMVPGNTTAANEPPVANAEPKHQTVYVGQDAWFSGNASYDPDGYIVNYSWSFGDGYYGNGIYVWHSYSSPGSYVAWLTVTDNDGGTDMDYANVTVLPSPTQNEPPVAYAYPDYQIVSVGEDAWVHGYYSYDNDGWIESYEWNFGDGYYGEGVNVTHAYSAPGIYTVILTVTDNDGAEDTDNCTIEVVGEPTNEPPVADAEPDSQTVEVGQDAWLDGNYSYDPDGFIISYEWNFGDGNSGSGVYVTHAYTAPGTYTVTLTVKDDDNATDTDTCTVNVEEAFPSPPTDLNAELVSSSLVDVKLTWTASEDDGAGDNDVEGYTVYKSTTGIYGDYEFEAWVEAEKIPGHRYEWIDAGAGDLDWNNYFYIVRANDSFNNEEQNENKVGKFVSYLEEDWNLMSVPLVQKDTSREVVLQTLGNNYATVQGYHAGKSRPWLHWHRNKPNYFNDVIEIDHKNGYYIDMIVPDHLVTAGKVATLVEINIETGWNLVGYPCFTELLRDDALSSIAGKYNMVERYDTTKDKEVRLGPDDYMEAGLGYWIHATDDCIWTLTN